MLFYDNYVRSRYLDPLGWQYRVKSNDSNTLAWFERAGDGDINLDLKNSTQGK